MVIGMFMPMLFTPEVDPHWSNVSLLLRGNESPIKDSSRLANVINTASGPTVVSDQSVFGGGSIRFQGAGYLEMAGRAELCPESADFTLETWFRPSTIANERTIFGGNGNNGNLILTMQGGTLVWAQQGIANNLTYNWNPPLNVWYHVAISRASNVGRMFINGNQVATGTVNTNYPVQTITAIGSYRSGTSSYSLLNGHIDDLRFTKGVARYAANFTPPTQQFPDF